MTLTRDEIRDLRREGHALKPVVRTGAAGLTDAVLSETERALHDHELIKVKLAGADRETRRSMLDELLRRTGADVVQQIGQVALIYRPRPEEDG